MAAWVIILYYFAMPDKKRTARLDWEDVRYFVALARHGTLSASARALRVNHATVARRIASLETLIGRALFDRRAGGYVLTAEGRPCSTRRAPWMKRRFPFCAAAMPARN
jgi:molybdenum-dependent DNA-binding transcriptional regulator ModE